MAEQPNLRLFGNLVEIKYRLSLSFLDCDHHQRIISGALLMLIDL